MAGEVLSHEQKHDPVNNFPFNELRTRFSNAIADRDPGEIHLVELEAGRLKKLLEVAVGEYDNMIKNCKVEIEKLDSEGAENGTD